MQGFNVSGALVGRNLAHQPDRAVRDRLTVDLSSFGLEDSVLVVLVANHVYGCSGLPAFSMAFTRQVGISPTEWRRQQGSAISM